MTSVPEFILRKLIVQGSLKTTPSGFSFVMRNSFAPGNLTAFSITIDSDQVPVEKISLQGEGQASRNVTRISDVIFHWLV